MDDIKPIIDEFLHTISNQKILGVLLTGSYAKGLQHPGSDMDIIVVTSNESTTRTRGNIEIQGVLVEYYCNTYRQIMKYFEIDWLHNNPMIYMAIEEGMIVFERYRVLTKLKQQAEVYARQPFRKLDDSRVSFEKYVIEDTKNKMISLAKKQSPTFDLSYYTNLRSIYDFYAKYLQQPVLKNYMLEDYLADNNRFKGSLQPFPDNEFAVLYLRAIANVVNKSFEERRKLYCVVADHVQRRTGDFSLNDWELTIPVDYSNTMDTRTRVF